MLRTSGRHGSGVRILASSRQDGERIAANCHAWLTSLGIPRAAVHTASEASAVVLELTPTYADAWLPEGDTLGLAERLGLASRRNPADLEHEILVAMLGSPQAFEFPHLGEFESAVRMRRQIVESARRTRIEFRTLEAERPEAYWYYDEDRGFCLRPGTSLIDGLVQATQPDASGRLYSFSCWRATEYIALLAIAREAAEVHPELLRRMTRQAETRALKAAAFENAYLRKHGSQQTPLPPTYFVPGDRTWFRNPEPISADVTGYEGSFTFYLGAGEFADFWRPGLTYTLTTKCLTIFHWRNAVVRDSAGENAIDETLVELHVAESLRDPSAMAAILQEMVRVQDPPDVFGGGCIEPTRESPRFVGRLTEDLQLPDAGPLVPPSQTVGCESVHATKSPA